MKRESIKMIKNDLITKLRLFGDDNVCVSLYIYGKKKLKCENIRFEWHFSIWLIIEINVRVVRINGAANFLLLLSQQIFRLARFIRRCQQITLQHLKAQKAMNFELWANVKAAKGRDLTRYSHCIQWHRTVLSAIPSFLWWNRRDYPNR